jgi:GT2 family glycosyltransferase
VSSYQRPLVSIVTPSFNMVGRLPRCVASVAGQSYPVVEHIIVDGASTDGTAGYLATQPDIRWVSEPDSGQSNAINKGLSMARGELLAWLGADDVLRPDAVTLVVESAARHPDSGLFYGDIETVSPSGTRRVVKPSPRFDRHALLRGNVISQPGTFFTRRAIETVGYIDETFHLTMDFELWLRMAIHGVQGVYLPHVLASFEVHAGSKTGSRSTLEFAEEEARAFIKHGQPHQAALAIDHWFWDTELNAVADLLRDRRFSEARARARDDAVRLHPVFGRPRLFLRAATLAPRLARIAVGFKRSHALSE